MRFDKKRLEELAALPDDKLWAEVQRIASGFGYTLPQTPPPHSDLEKMRAAVKSQSINPTDAIRLLNQYKKTGRIE